jgi:hypothetical protein
VAQEKLSSFTETVSLVQEESMVSVNIFICYSIFFFCLFACFFVLAQGGLCFPSLRWRKYVTTHLGERLESKEYSVAFKNL